VHGRHISGTESRPLRRASSVIVEAVQPAGAGFSVRYREAAGGELQRAGRKSFLREHPEHSARVEQMVAECGRGGRRGVSAPALMRQALDEATARLSKHDQLSLADPGLGGAVEEYYDEYTEALRQAVLVISRQSSSLMLGVMGSDATEAVRSLRAWQEALGLEQTPLRMPVHDAEEGTLSLSSPLLDTAARVAVESGGGGGGGGALGGLGSAGAGGATASGPLATYLKFNSRSGLSLLKPHDGPFRGVILTATIGGATLQYAGLPLALFDGRLDWLALGGKWRRARLHTVE